MTDPPTPPAGDNPPTPMSRRDLEARIIAKAWRDPKYKNALARNPKAVLQRELAALDPSIVLPAALKVKVHEETPNTYHLVVPRNPKDITLHELVGDRLEAVAPQTIAVVVVNVGPATTTTAVVTVVGITNFVGSVVSGSIVVSALAASNSSAVSNVVA